MKKQIFKGLASLLLPMGAYAGISPAGSYQPHQRSYLRSGPNVGMTLDTARISINADSRSAPADGHNELELAHGQPARELMVVDAAVPDKHIFYREVKPGVDIVEIDSSQPGLSQLIEALGRYKNLSALHIVSHAEDGVLLLGNSRITAENIKYEIEAFAALNGALREGGDLLLYGCDLAKSEAGTELLDIVQRNTHLDLAASSNLTGSSIEDGDWSLEIQRGEIESGLPFSVKATADFSHVLATTHTLASFGFEYGGDGANSGCASDSPDYESWSYYALTKDSYIGCGFLGIDNGVGNGFGGTTVDLRHYHGGSYSPAYLVSDKDGYAGTSLIEIRTTGTSFQLTGVELTEFPPNPAFNDGYAFSNVKIIGYPSGGGSPIETDPLPVGDDKATTTDFSFGSAELANLAGHNLTRFRVSFYNEAGSLASGMQFVSFTTAPPNTAPTLTTITPLTGATEDTPFTISYADLAAAATDEADADGDTLSFRVEAVSIGTLTKNSAAVTPGVTLLSTGEELVWTPAADANGTLNAFTVRAWDGTTTSSSDVQVQVNVTAVGDDPEVSGLPSDVVVLEDTASNFDLSAATFAEADGSSITVTLTAGAGSFAASSGGSIIITGSGTGTLTLTGTPANINTFLDTTSNIQYTGAANASGNDATTVTVNATDGINIPLLGTINVDITGVNDPPGATNLDQTVPYTEDPGGSLALADIVVSDVDGGDTITATLTLTDTSAGSLTTGTFGSATSTYNAGIWTVSGSTADVNAALAAVAFTPAANYDQDATITTRIRDAADTGPADGTITLDVTPVNDAPTDIALSSASIDQSATGAGAVVGSLSSTDVDTSDTHTYTLVADGASDSGSCGATGADGNASFQIDNDDLETSGSVSPGTHSVCIETDDGTVTFQEAFTITVTDDVAPTVSSVDVPGDATYVAGQELEFTINTDEDVTVSGTPQIALTIGATIRQAEYVSGSGSSALLFRYTVLAGDNDTDGIAVGALSANGGTLRDSADNDLDTTLNSVGSTDNVLVDAVAPSVSSVAVPTNATYVAGENLEFTVNTSENVTISGTPRIALTIGATTRQATYVSGSGSSAIVFRYTVQAGDSDTDGIAVAGAIDANGGTLQDSSGNDLNTTLNSVGATTSVLVDAVAPTVSSVSVPANDTYVTGQNLDFTVNTDENITVNTTGGTPQIALTIGATTRQATYLSGSGTSALVFRYTVQAGDNDTDGVAVAAAIDSNGGTLRDAAGNDLTLTLNSVGATTAVLVDAVAPTVSSVGVPTDGTYAAGQNLDFTVNANENITVDTGGGTPRIELTIGATTRYASYLSGSGTSALVFRYTVQAGDSDSDGIAVAANLDVNGGTLRDGVNNDLDTALNSVGSTASVLVDTVAPTVSSVSVPANATYITGQNLDFTVNADENITVNSGGGTPRIALTVGATTRYADYLSGSGTSAVVFRYTVQAGDSDTDGIAVAASLDANGGTLQDGAGNSLNTTLNSVGATTSVLVDAIVPTVGSVSVPANSTYLTGQNLDFTVNTDENVTVNTGGGTPRIALTIGATTRYASYLSGSGTSAIVFRHTVQAGDIDSDGIAVAAAIDANGGTLQDSAGNDLNTTLNSVGATTSVLVDAQVPTLDGSAPADNATGVAFDADITLNFSENVSAGAGSVSVHDAADDSLVESFVAGSLSIVADVVTIDLTSNLTPTHNYYVRVDSDAFEDAAGNAYAGIVDETTLNFTVGNDAPVAGDDSDTTDEDTAVAVDVLANDTDSDSALNAASTAIVTAPANGSTSINSATGVITYTPAADFNGSDSFTYTVEDVHGTLSNTATVNVTVTAINDAPVAVNDLESTLEDTNASFDVAANDTDVDTGDSADTATITIVTPPANGSATVNAGQVDYDPDADFNGTDTFTYTIEDQNGALSNVATVTINVTGVNDLPTAANDSASVDEDDFVDIDVMDNDSDIDGTLDSTTVTVMANPANGSTSVDALTGVITYTPSANYNGPDSFTYVVRDDAGGTSNAATVNITVNSINDAPTAVDDTAIMLEDTAHEVNVLGDDSDLDGSLVPGSVEVVTAPAQGSTSVDPTTGAITYTPGNDFTGADSFTYRVRDNEGAWSNTATVTMTVDNVNDAPVATDDNETVDEDVATVLTILANDTDIDDTIDVTTLTVVTTPTNGVVLVNNDGTVTYTSNANFNGSDSFTYEVSDATGDTSNEATVTLTVTAVNDLPTISGTPAVSVSEGSAYSFTPSASDVESATLTFSVVNLPDWASFSTATGALTGTPGNADSGIYADIGISVSDGTDSTALPAFAIEVIDMNVAPVISGTASTSAVVGQTYSFTPSVTDPDTGDTLTFSVTGLPNWASFNTGTGEVSGTPADDDVGDHGGIAISVSDGSESAALAAFGITVAPGPDTDGDTVSDYQEGLDETDPEDPTDYLDLVPPILTAPDEVTLDAIALYTPVHIKQLLGLPLSASNAEVDEALDELATDNVDGTGCCDPIVDDALLGVVVLLAPGRNEVSWLAEDRKGNMAEVTQIVNLRPLVSLGKDQTTVEGNTVTISVILNGESPFYPFTVPFVIDETSTVTDSDHDLVNGTVTFTEPGQTQATIAVALTEDGMSDDNETLVVRLDDRTSNAEDLADGYDPLNPDIYDINSGAKTRHVIRIVEGNLPPDASLQLQQADVDTVLITASGGPVTATVSVFDANAGDTHDLAWSASDNRLIDTDGDATDGTLVFDPAGLNPGRYKVQVAVTDSEGATTSTRLFFRVVASLPTLSADDDTDGDGIDDLAEGTGDSDGDAIPDYLDNLGVTNVVPEEATQTRSYLMECEPGVQCRLGRFSLLSELGGTLLVEQNLSALDGLIPDPDYTPVGGIFDFEVKGLSAQGQSVGIVIPQRVPVPDDAVYRKFQDGAWFTFVEDDNNGVYSTDGDAGYCPPPGDEAWQSGLTPGHLCVQLIIEDGGPNDADGMVNGAVEDPGAVSIPSNVVVYVDSNSGGGAFDKWLLALLGSLLLFGKLGLKRGRRLGTILKHHGSKAASIAALLFCGSLMFTATPTKAQDWLEDKVSLELGVYNTESARSSGAFISDMAADGVTVDLQRYETNRNAWQIAVDYKFSEWVTVQVGYLDLGEVRVGFFADSADYATIEQALEKHYPFNADGFTLAYRYSHAWRENIKFTVDAGLFSWDQDINVRFASLNPDGDSGTDPLLGLGVGYQVNPQATVGLRYQRLMLDPGDMDLWGATVNWRF